MMAMSQISITAATVTFFCFIQKTNGVTIPKNLSVAMAVMVSTDETSDATGIRNIFIEKICALVAMGKVSKDEVQRMSSRAECARVWQWV